MSAQAQDSHTTEHAAFAIIIIGQEGDPEDLHVRPAEQLDELLVAALRKLYAPNPPAADLYDVVLNGKFVEPLTQSIASVGIGAGTKVSILPKTVTRGER